MTIDDARKRLAEVDEEIVDRIAERLQLADEIGRDKKEAGVAIRDFQREADVLQRARKQAEKHGVRPETVEDVFEQLIRESLHVQEEAHTHAQYTAGERDAAVIGGAGRMGQWFATFLSAQGYRVLIEDPDGPPEGFEALGGLAEARDLDLVVVSVPIRETGGVLEELEGADGLVVDIASIKAPFEDRLRSLAETTSICSIHPLWGPGTRTLAGRNLLLMDCGDEEAVEAARDVFDGTLARPIVLELAEHDEAMAYTLGLAHAVNVWFAGLLRDSGREFDDFAAKGGSTFLRQARLARDVVAESPTLYHDIQVLNPHMDRVYDAMRDGLASFIDAVDDRDGFIDEMTASDEFMEEYAWESRS